MKSAMEIIAERLVLTGMKRNDVTYLLARFLLEESFQRVEFYIECLKEINEENNKSGMYSQSDQEKDFIHTGIY